MFRTLAGAELQEVEEEERENLQYDINKLDAGPTSNISGVEDGPAGGSGPAINLILVQLANSPQFHEMM